MASVQNGLEERDWTLLLKRIEDGKCTPLLGPGLSAGILPGRSEIAQSWAHQYEYPLADDSDLARVAQYLAVQFDPVFPKEEIQNRLSQAAAPDFSLVDQPHAVLAGLNLPVYITTSYDDLMTRALVSRHKDPKRDLCRWNGRLLRSQPSILETDYTPTAANPLVFHLHGHVDSPESMVLTEDDYLDFLVNVSSDTFQLPARIQRALTGASLLFIGYDPMQWDFRVLFRGLVAATESGLRRISVTVQLPPVPSDTPAAAQEKVRGYLNDYFDITDRQMRVYWGTAQEFLTELNQRWQGSQAPAAAGQAEDSSGAIDLMSLLNNLTEAFAREELITLAFELRVPYEDLPEAKSAFARDLIAYLQRRKRLHELIEACRRERPNTEW